MAASEEKERKRKRKQSGEEQPKKKKAISDKHHDSRPISVNVLDESTTLAPVFVNAPGLQLPNNIRFRPYQKEVKDRKGRPAGSELLLHSASHPRLDYVASEPAQGSFQRHTRHYVGIYDPETSSLRIVPAKQLTVQCTLKRGFIDDQKRAAAQAKHAALEAAGAVTNSKYAQRVALGEEFGTKKAKKAIRSAATNAVSAPATGGDVVRITDHTQSILESANQGGGGGDEGDAEARKAQLNALVNNAHPRPTPNLDAERPGDVYKLKFLVGSQELDIIDVSDWIESFETGQSIQTPSRFVSFRYHSISGHGSKLKMKAMKYLLALILFVNALESRRSSKKLPKREELDTKMAGVDRNLVFKIKQRFAPGGGTMNSIDVQRLMLCACAIALDIDDCKTDVHDLQEDLKLTTTEIKSYYKELGCKVELPKDKELAELSISKAAARQHQIAKLTVPFSLPEVRQRRAKRG